MALCRMLALALLFLPVAAWASQTQSQQNQNQNQQQQGMQHDRLQALVTHLGLSNEQKEQIRKIFEKYEDKEHRLVHELWSNIHQEKEALLPVLNAEQSNRVPEVLKEERVKELEKIANKLNLSNEQRQRIKDICEQFEPKFEQFVKESGDRNFKQMHELGREVFAQIRAVLTEDQRAKVPGILREEFQMWRDPNTRAEHFRVIGDRLNLDQTQKDQAQKIITEYHQKFEKLHDDLRQVCEAECKEIEQVLTDQQRTKLREVMKFHGK